MTWALAHVLPAPSRIRRRRFVAGAIELHDRSFKKGQKPPTGERRPGGALTRRIRDAIKFDLCGRQRRLAMDRASETFRRTL